MKNIHVLSTDKPSKIGYIFESESYHIFTNGENPNNINDNLACYRHIYITSDEEIKEGDWALMFDDFGNLFLCDKPQQYLGIEKGHHLNKGLRKIILTTDQDLIKDGVQAIDDEFLEWFVKNPSCEYVEVKSWIKTYEDGSSFDRMDYEIIIPKEEPCEHFIPTIGCIKDVCSCNKDPKQAPFKHKVESLSTEEVLANRSDAYEFIDFDKQETLEEAAENYSKITLNKGGLISDKQVNGFIAGVKWQTERMYSEKELRNAMNWMLTQYFEFHEWPAMGRVDHYVQSIKQQEQ